MALSFELLKPRQWVKNLVAYFPLVFSKSLLIPDKLLAASATAGILCLASSASYLLNDLFDLERDRQHPVKRLRPVASGKIPAGRAAGLAFLLAAAAAAAAFRLNPDVGRLVSLFLFVNVAYSLLLKNLPLADLFCIGGLFLLRVLAGSSAVKVPTSFWLASEIFLLALLLGLAKRQMEFAVYGDSALSYRKTLAFYRPAFTRRAIFLTALLAAVVYTLYCVETGLLATLPFAYYGTFRYVVLVSRKTAAQDPIWVFLSDRPGLLSVALWLGACLAIFYRR